MKDGQTYKLSVLMQSNVRCQQQETDDDQTSASSGRRLSYRRHVPCIDGPSQSVLKTSIDGGWHGGCMASECGETPSSRERFFTAKHDILASAVVLTPYAGCARHTCTVASTAGQNQPEVMSQKMCV